MEVVPLSQKEQITPDNMRICSPVTLCMALNALGRPIVLSQVLQNVYDPASDIFGNWFFNTAYASQQGLDVHFWRFGSLEELGDFCTPKSLVAASIAYDENELPGAAQPKTAGHFVLIRGWKDGKILVADPAAETSAEVLRAYEAQPFAQAWLKNILRPDKISSKIPSRKILSQLPGPPAAIPLMTTDLCSPQPAGTSPDTGFSSRAGPAGVTAKQAGISPWLFSTGVALPVTQPTKAGLYVLLSPNISVPCQSM